MLTETSPNDTLTNTSPQLQFLQLLAVFASIASPLFELGPDPERPYACVYFSNKLLHIQVSAQPAVRYHRASFQCC